MQPTRLSELFEQARTTPQKRAADRHPNRDFFVADILDWALKDDLHSMEHPLFSLSKKPDKNKPNVQHYDRDGTSVTIKWGPDGRATIWDKDILIYAISQLVEALNQSRPINRKVRITAYALLVSTNRHIGGRNYKLLKQSFARLAGTRIETNIATAGRRVREGFGLLDNWKIVDRTPDGQMIAVELTLNEWLFNAIVGHEVLTLNRDYFLLNGGLERRLYELARKHCGNQPQWKIGLSLLHTKSGSSAPLKKFRQHMKEIATLPDYNVSYHLETDQVTFERRLSVHRAPESAQ